jgi:hypothetical protein
MSALISKADIDPRPAEVGYVQISDVLAKAGIRTNAHWKVQWGSFVPTRSRHSEPFAGGL